MKHHQLRLILALCLFATVNALATVRYVNVNSATPTPPYTNWNTAAVTIQDAVDAGEAGDQILVTKGVYQTGGRPAPPYAVTNRLAVTNAIAIQSVNGPEFTIIRGARGPSPINDFNSIRCVYLAAGASLSGFTLTNGGALAGGGIQSEGTAAIVSNCWITGNSSGHFGGGAESGSLNNCTLTGNLSQYGGGVDSSTLNNCKLTGNSATGLDGGYGLGGGAFGSILNNCTLTANLADGGGGAAACTLNNCTVAGNSATLAFGGVLEGALTNCILYYNTANTEPNYDSDGTALAYSCTTPMPTNGVGNITNAPLFVNQVGGNLRLQSNSPCINAGYDDYVTSPVDLDGNERVVGGTVDMGAYEWVAMPTHYVSLTSPNPTPPYLSWSTAATSIQDAVDAAWAGDQIMVTNGVYATGRYSAGGLDAQGVLVTKLLSLRSVNGPQFTVIWGGDSWRCVTLGGGANLSGFTLSNGTITGYGYVTLRGGGVFCHGTNEVVSNCVLIGNSADEGGGAYHGTLINCTLTNNSARYDGGGAAGAPSRTGFPTCRLINCTLTGNRAHGSDGGGGAYGGSLTFSDRDGCELINCTLTDNWAYDSGFGYGAGAVLCTLKGCTLVGNHGESEAFGCTLKGCTITGGGSYSGADGCTLNNCTVSGYSAGQIGARRSTLYNCTLTRNTTGAFGGTLKNCIVYDNWGPDYDGGSTLNFCCAKVMPTSGIGNITNAPLFINGGNLRLQSNSPCINAGRNAFAPAGPDLDGNPRIAGGTVDIGAFEFQLPSSVLSYAWAQQYGLPTDGSADYSDSDTDQMNNWQEWIAGTVPTAASSALRLLNPTKAVAGVTVSWQSVSNRTYFLERATNLGAAPPFSLLTSNVVGQPGTTSYTDTNATGPGPFFYRVGVQ